MKLTERAKRALEHAQTEARQMQHNYMGTEHLLLGLEREGGGVAAKALNSLGVDAGRLRGAIEYRVGRGDRPIPPGADLSLTPRTKRVLELAKVEARQMNHSFLGTEHLLLGLAREGEGVAAAILEELGVTMEGLRTAVIDVLAQAMNASGASAPRENVISCRVDANDLAAIDLLVEAGIRSTRSDAAQWLIHAGVTTNRALFEQVSDTVEEIRRLRDQARATAQRLAGGDDPSDAAGDAAVNS